VADYTDRAAVVVGHAVRHAETALHDEVSVEDLLIGLLVAGDGVAAQVMKGLRVDRELLWRRVGGDSWRPSRGKELPVRALDLAYWMTAPRPPMSEAAQEVLALAAEEAGPAGDVSTEHILFGLLRHGVEALAAQGLTLDDVVAETDRQMAEFQRGRPALLDPAMADELIAVPRVTVPAEVRAFDERLADVRRRKEALVDAEDFPAAAAARDEEKALAAQRAALVKGWADSVDLVAVVEELEALREAVDRMRE
jgi:ATP-dependent Clp protease ATP-binding subunit ClpA